MQQPGAVLVIAASDSSGGAGLTRDVQTLTHFGTLARCALTAVTVQTDRQVLAMQIVPPELVVAQMRAALDSGITAIKIGLLASTDTIQAVAEALPPREQLPIVLDPVLVASSGTALLEPAALPLLRECLLPRVTLLTPNIPEAATLLQTHEAHDRDTCQTQVRALLALGPQAVLLKGGHGQAGGTQRVIDWLGSSRSGILELSTPRIAARRRGTGCSAASAIAAQLAVGVPLEEACKRAQTYIGQALRAVDCGSAELPDLPAA
jgi:hydroxymethylpyrimidine/phosphomethylpyrimidine kinase